VSAVARMAARNLLAYVGAACLAAAAYLLLAPGEQEPPPPPEVHTGEVLNA
jgi:hypothetical protein